MSPDFSHICYKLTSKSNVLHKVLLQSLDTFFSFSFFFFFFFSPRWIHGVRPRFFYWKGLALGSDDWWSHPFIWKIDQCLVNAVLFTKANCPLKWTLWRVDFMLPRISTLVSSYPLKEVFLFFSFLTFSYFSFRNTFHFYYNKRRIGAGRKYWGSEERRQWPRFIFNLFI